MPLRLLYLWSALHCYSLDSCYALSGRNSMAYYLSFPCLAPWWIVAVDSSNDVPLHLCLDFSAKALEMRFVCGEADLRISKSWLKVTEAVINGTTVPVILGPLLAPCEEPVCCHSRFSTAARFDDNFCRSANLQMDDWDSGWNW